MQVLVGYNCIVGLRLVTDGPYYPIFCTESITYRFQQEIIGATTVTSGGYKEKRSRMHEAFISVSGLTKIDNTDGQICFFYLAQESVRTEIQQIQLKFTDYNGNQKYIYADVLISSGQIGAQPGEFAECDIEFAVTGAVNITSTPAVLGSGFTELSDYWQTVNGNSFISGASSGEADGTPYTLGSTDTPLLVFLEGTEYDLITGTPTAGERECVFNSAAHKISFPSDIVFDGTQRVAVLWRRTS